MIGSARLERTLVTVGCRAALISALLGFHDGRSSRRALNRPTKRSRNARYDTISPSLSVFGIAQFLRQLSSLRSMEQDRYLGSIRFDSKGGRAIRIATTSIAPPLHSAAVEAFRCRSRGSGRESEGEGRKIGKAEGLRIIDINILGVFRIYISRVSAISFAWRI